MDLLQTAVHIDFTLLELKPWKKGSLMSRCGLVGRATDS